MKINVTVDLTEFYAENEGDNFSEEIKRAIASDVKFQILKEWKDKIGDEFNKAVIAEVEKQKENLITDTFNKLAVDAKVKKQYSSGEMISIAQWITEEFERMHLSDNKLNSLLASQLTKSSDRISKELKDRYDLLFASQIVSKLNEAGMLKEDVAKILLG